MTGEHFTMTDAYCEPKGVQTPHPPITIGGGGEMRTLRAVARYAQRWNIPFTDPATLAHKRDVLAQHCEAIGRDPAEIDITAQVGYDPAAGPTALAETCAGLGEAGCQLAIVGLRASEHRAEVLEPIATALAALG